MYSDMSTRISALASANRNRASPRASSVLPTPVGPEKMNDPIGRLGSLSPARLRRMAREITAIASSWPTTVWCISSSMRSRRAVSASWRRVTGIPVQRDTMNATASSVLLVPLAQPLQDLDRLVHRGRIDDHRLEAALERAVLLDVLAVLVERRRPYALQLAPRERRLQHVGGVHRPLGRARAHQCMQLV